MKKVILGFAAIFIAQIANGQADSLNIKSNQGINGSRDGMSQNRERNLNSDQDISKNTRYKVFPDGIVMQNGNMVKWKDGKSMKMDQEMTFSNGTKVLSDGTCISRDGTRTTIKEGQHIDMSGHISPDNMDDKNIYLVPDSVRGDYNK